MKRANRQYKWHYFKADDELCHYDVNLFKTKPDIILVTACNKNIEEVVRHTEFKNKVTCKTCMRILVREDNLNFNLT